VWKAVSRPRLRVRTAKNLQLGHGGLGGALGLNVSIASEEPEVRAAAGGSLAAADGALTSSARSDDTLLVVDVGD